MFDLHLCGVVVNIMSIDLLRGSQYSGAEPR